MHPELIFNQISMSSQF